MRKVRRYREGDVIDSGGGPDDYQSGGGGSGGGGGDTSLQRIYRDDDLQADPERQAPLPSNYPVGMTDASGTKLLPNGTWQGPQGQIFTVHKPSLPDSSNGLYNNPAPDTSLQRDFRDDDLHPNNVAPLPPADSKFKPGLASMGGGLPSWEQFKARMDKYKADEARYDAMNSEYIGGTSAMDKALARQPRTPYDPNYPVERGMADTVEEGNKRGGVIRKMAKGGAVKKMASGGSVSSASKRGDGIAQRGKTKGRMC